MLPHILQYYGPIGFWEDFWIFLHVYFYLKLRSHIVAHSITGDHDLNKLESLKPDGGFTQGFASLPNDFWKHFFFKYQTLHVFVNYKLSSYKEVMVHHLNKLESPLPVNALCQILWKFAKWLLVDTLRLVKHNLSQIKICHLIWRTIVSIP